MPIGQMTYLKMSNIFSTVTGYVLKHGCLRKKGAVHCIGLNNQLHAETY